MSSPIEALIEQSQDQHRRYLELFGTNPVRGEGLREVRDQCRAVAEQARDLRQQVIDLNFSTAVTG
jgi:hypothetical protein